MTVTDSVTIGQRHTTPLSGAFAAAAGKASAHPLQAVRQLVDQSLSQSTASTKALGRDLGMKHDQTECVVRTMVLRALYEFTTPYSLEEQLRYNMLYRWFVGLDAAAGLDESTLSWTSERLMHRSPAARTLMRDLIDCPNWRSLRRHVLFSPGAPVAALLGAVPQPGKSLDRRLRKACDYIAAHIAISGLGPQNVASALCISRRSLYALCATHGTTPKRLIRSIRLEGCREALCNRDDERKITEIAFDYGFRDSATFSRMFKTHFGVTPSALRSSGASAARESQRKRLPHAGIRDGALRLSPVALSESFGSDKIDSRKASPFELVVQR